MKLGIVMHDGQPQFMARLVRKNSDGTCKIQPVTFEDRMQHGLRKNSNLPKTRRFAVNVGDQMTVGRGVFVFKPSAMDVGNAAYIRNVTQDLIRC